MFKKIALILAFLFIFVSVSFAIEPVKMDIPTTPGQIEQIKWAHNQGYVWGVLASHGIWEDSPNPINFVLPVIITAWEIGYVEGVLEVQKFEKKFAIIKKRYLKYTNGQWNLP